MTKGEYTKGFTLVELLVVIAIIAILAGALFLVINPADIMKKSRDSRRISEIGELNKAMAAAVADQKITAWPATGTKVTRTQTATNTTVDGAGWFGGFTGTLSAFIPKLPVDPGTTFYAGCVDANGTWEINATLEHADNLTKMTGDGGNNNALYEVGTSSGHTCI